jgi:subtilisin family serine protease
VARLNQFQRIAGFVLAGALVAACGGGGGAGGIGGGGGGVIPTPPPVFGPYGCPTAAGQAPSSVAAISGSETARHAFSRGSATAVYVPDAVAVVYSKPVLESGRALVSQRESALGASLVGENDYPRLGITTRALRVDPARVTQTMVSLRAQPGVQRVSRIVFLRASTVTNPFVTNDPYFKGFNGTSAPYFETAAIPGQWDMHAIGLERAWGYSIVGNSTVNNPSAVGSPSIKVAIVDTGQDTTHPELAGKIVRQGCFITHNGVQSTSQFTNDPSGHGTDVSGIAAATTNNTLGFVGVGGNVSVMLYRVFPAPDSSCDGGAPDNQCFLDTRDVASALNDAVANGANVVNFSFGGAGPDDAIEGPAIANAIAHNVIVVASAGNEGGTSLDSPASDPNVIAVGATGLLDSGPITEAVASYSNYDPTHSGVRSASAWGIVAPGGNAASGSDSDDLHWIENLWTSTPFSAADAGNCGSDFGTASVADCRTLIAGTSMSSPHVAGAVALILSVAPQYGSAAAMKTLLCQTADDIADARQGCGRLNVYRAMAKALNDPNLP